MTGPLERDLAAKSAYARGDTARATATLIESVRLNPFDAVALNNLAVNYAAQGDYQNAISLLERAQRIAPSRADIANNLANLKAWLTQDNQFALGSRGVPQALNLPRSEDIPKELPPLWTPPNASVLPPQAQQGSSLIQNASQPNYQQQTIAQPFQSTAQPAQYQTTLSSSAYTQPQVTTAPSEYSSRPATAHSRRATTSERLSSVTTRQKKKKQQLVDCPVP